MANRDINIPVGPDTTQETPIIDAEPLIKPVSDDARVEREQISSTGVFDALPASEDAPFASDEAAKGIAEEKKRARKGERLPGNLTEDEAQSQGLDDVQMSFLALRDSIGQGRELKARERDREELGQRIKEDREELSDREEIIANYHNIVAEQDAIIAKDTQQREARKAELAQVSASIDEATDALDRMRDYNDAQLEPLETALGRARATAEQAKNDERSRKAELNAAEKEADRAEGGDSTVAQAKVKVLEEAHEEALARSGAAKEALDEAQRVYDEARDRVEQAEAPLERSIEDLTAQAEELKESVSRLGESISAARKRRQYCDSVYQYPEETTKLRRSVEADESLAQKMDSENKELRARLETSKRQSLKAKVAIGVVILIAVVFIVLFFVLKANG